MIHMKKIILLVLLLFIMLVGVSRSQENYRLGPEDEIEIKVWDHEDLTRKTRIGLNGTITYPFIGEIKAGGLTIQELQKEIEHRLGPKYIIDPHVSITVTEYKSQKFFVVGNVQKAGTYPLTKTIRVVEAISLAGGVSATGTVGKPLVTGGVAIIVRASPGDKTDQPRMPEQSPPGQKVTVSLTAAMAGDPKNNLEIKNGDTIYVPNLMFYATGEVKSPGRYPYDEDMTVLMAVATAGGFTDKASSKGIYILRETAGSKQKIKVRLEDFIQPGDTVVVPESWF
jgi:polysaccharide export outer membrane protein